MPFTDYTPTEPLSADMQLLSEQSTKSVKRKWGFSWLNKTLTNTQNSAHGQQSSILDLITLLWAV